MDAQKSNSLIQLIGTLGGVLEQLGDTCADNLALHVAKLAAAAAPLGEGAWQVVDGHNRALRSFAASSGIGAVLRENAHTLGAAMAEASDSGALADAFEAGLQAWENHGHSVGVPFPERRGDPPAADFDTPPERCGCDFCASYGCHCEKCKEGVAAKDAMPMGPLSVMEMWKACGETPEGWFAVVDRVKGEKVAP